MCSGINAFGSRKHLAFWLVQQPAKHHIVRGGGGDGEQCGKGVLLKLVISDDNSSQPSPSTLQMQPSTAPVSLFEPPGVRTTACALASAGKIAAYDLLVVIVVDPFKINLLPSSGAVWFLIRTLFTEPVSFLINTPSKPVCLRLFFFQLACHLNLSVCLFFINKPF